MSVEQMARVFKHSRSKGAARLVLLALADEAHESGAVTAYKRSQAHLARKANTDKRTVGRALEQLQAIGELTVLRHGDGRESSDYMLTIPEGVGEMPTPQPDQDPSGRVGETPTLDGQDADPGMAGRPPREGEAPPPSSRSFPVPPVPPGTSAPAPSARRRKPKAEPKVLDPLTECADGIARHVWDNRTPRPAQSFVGMRSVLVRVLGAGWSPEQVQAAAMRVPAMTANAMDFELNRGATPARVQGGGFSSAGERRQERNDAAFDLVLGMVAEHEAATQTPAATQTAAALGGAIDVKELTA